MSAARRDGPPEGGWGALTVAELGEELEARGLPKSGRKGELVARLEEDDASARERPGAPEEPEGAPEGPEAAEGEAEEEAASEGEEAGAERPRRRRGSEVAAARPDAAPRRPTGPVVVSARAKYVRSAPRKARLVMDHIRGKPVERARAILQHAPRAVSTDIMKLLNSAVANAESGYELGPDELRIKRAFVDEGPTIKRFRPRALGRATRIDRRTSHMTIELTTTDEDGR